MKTCTKCLVEKSETEFWRDNRNLSGLLSTCKTCRYPGGLGGSRRAVGKTTEERFWSLVDKSDGCWEWAGGRNGGGYGLFRSTNPSKLVHRYSAELAGLVADGLSVCHTCDNPGCVNPAHLFVGTQKDNAADMIRKNRTPVGSYRLTKDDVSEILELYRSGDWTQVRLAEKYGVSQPLISKIVAGKVYGHFKLVPGTESV
jgi:hypothetical protein